MKEFRYFRNCFRCYLFPFSSFFYKIHLQAYFLLGSSGIHMNQVTLEKIVKVLLNLDMRSPSSLNNHLKICILSDCLSVHCPSWDCLPKHEINWILDLKIGHLSPKSTYWSRHTVNACRYLRLCLSHFTLSELWPASHLAAAALITKKSWKLFKVWWTNTIYTEHLYKSWMWLRLCLHKQAA